MYVYKVYNMCIRYPQLVSDINLKKYTTLCTH